MSTTNEGNLTDVTNEASLSLAQDLIRDASSSNSSPPSPRLYLTTLGLIILIHVLFVYQWIKKKNRRDVVVTYEQIIRKKQFYKWIPAILSHPPVDDSMHSSTVESSGHGHQAVSSGTSFEIEYGDGYNYRNMSTHNGSRIQVFGKMLLSKMKHEIIKALSSGPLSGLPLLAYITHILWQCRPLEEIFDYAIDVQNPSIHNPNFNISTIIERDTIIQNSIRKKVLPKSSRKMTPYNFAYYRVLFSLIMVSSLLDFFVTYLILRFARKHSERLPPRSKNLLESQSRRGICTLTSLTIAVLEIYSRYFPYTPVSVLPFIDMRFLFGRSSDLTFIMVYLIMTCLSYKSYPLMGMFYGSVTGLLWINGIIQFFADCYWGLFFILLFVFICAASIKAEIKDGERKRLNDFLFWLDYVSWDSEGNL